MGTRAMAELLPRNNEQTKFQKTTSLLLIIAICAAGAGCYLNYKNGQSLENISAQLSQLIGVQNGGVIVQPGVTPTPTIVPVTPVPVVTATNSGTPPPPVM